MSEVIDYDKYGYCVFCHKDLLIRKIVGGREVVTLSPLYDQKEYKLTDGSKMQVAVCKDCLNVITDKDKPVIMKAVIKGWEKELEGLPTWSDKQKEDYMRKYSRLEII